MWGRQASPRPAGLGMPQRVHRLSDNISDPLLESVGSWFRLAVAIARPAASLWPISASGFANASLCLRASSREVGCLITFDFGLPCESLDQS